MNSQKWPLFQWYHETSHSVFFILMYLDLSLRISVVNRSHELKSSPMEYISQNIYWWSRSSKNVLFLYEKLWKKIKLNFEQNTTIFTDENKVETVIHKMTGHLCQSLNVLGVKPVARIWYITSVKSCYSAVSKSSTFAEGYGPVSLVP